MKKFLILFLVFNFAQSQTSLRFGFDIANATMGSVPTGNKPALDFNIGVSKMLFNKQLQTTLYYENFNKIGLQRLSLEVGKPFYFNNFTFTYGVSIGAINRYTLEGKNIDDYTSFNYGTNATLMYNLSNKITIGVLNEVQKRTDLEHFYGGTQIRFSNFLILNYNL